MTSIVDITDGGQPARWRGVSFRVAAGEVPRGAPACRVECAQPGLFRICLRARSLLLARNRRYLRGVDWLRAVSEDPLELIPPQPHAIARELGSDLRAWARRYAEQLLEAPARLIHEGDWRIEPGVALADARARSRSWEEGAPVSILGLADERSGDRGSLLWDLNGSSDTLVLRAPPPIDSPRVKAARKLAREGILPPLLLWFVSGLDAFVLLDGHERLRAAQLEEIAPTALILSSVRTLPAWITEASSREKILASLEKNLRRSSSPATLDSVNARLRALHPEPERVSSRTRAWPIPGGAEAWLAQARALCGDDVPGELLAPI